MGSSRLLAGTAGAWLVAGLAMAAGPATAAADVDTRAGYEVPAQPYLHNPDQTDWLGSYGWRGKQVWCVQFAHKAPDTDEAYQPGDALLDKWGAALPADVAADISYLLLRNSDTTSADNAAALAHLLHSWTSAPRDDGDLDPAKDFEHIGYDVDAHYRALPSSAQRAVAVLRADANANHGPWTAKLAAPDGTQTIGQPGRWTITVLNAAGKGLGDVPVKLTATDAQLGGVPADGVVRTPADGGPLVLDVTPTGPNPAVNGTVDSPAAQPLVQVPAAPSTQRIITTGGENRLEISAAATARNAPGQLTITKVDAGTGAGLVGVALRLTGSDRSTPAVGQDGTALTGQDGLAVVSLTGQDGTINVPGLRTPQDVCVVEAAAPPGYDEGYDANSPPSVCGTVNPGAVLTLSLANKPNTPQVPRTIPAGAEPRPVVMATAPTLTVLQPAALVGLGLLVLASLTLGGLVWRRRANARR